MPASPSQSLESSLREILDALAPAAPVPSPAPTVLEETPCVICRLTVRSVTRYLETLFSEFVNDPPLRLRLRQAGGFCPEHTRTAAEVGDVLALAILTHDLTDATLERWKVPAQSSTGWRARFSRRESANPMPLAACPACAEEAAAISRYVTALADGLAHLEAWESWKEKGVLCVAHGDAVAMLADAQTAHRLREQQSAHYEVLRSELAEIIRKHDYRFRGETWGPERTAWQRALALLRRPRS